MLRVNVGKGSVTVVNGVPFQFRQFLEGDNAALLMAAVQLRKNDEVHFLSEEEHPSMLSLMWYLGWPIVLLVTCAHRARLVAEQCAVRAARSRAGSGAALARGADPRHRVVRHPLRRRQGVARRCRARPERGGGGDASALMRAFRRANASMRSRGSPARTRRRSVPP